MFLRLLVSLQSDCWLLVNIQLHSTMIFGFSMVLTTLVARGHAMIPVRRRYTNIFYFKFQAIIFDFLWAPWIHDILDGSEIPTNHLTCMQPWKWWDVFHINWSAGAFSINTIIRWDFKKAHPYKTAGRLPFLVPHNKKQLYTKRYHKYFIIASSHIQREPGWWCHLCFSFTTALVQRVEVEKNPDHPTNGRQNFPLLMVQCRRWSVWGNGYYISNFELDHFIS